MSIPHSKTIGYPFHDLSERIEFRPLKYDDWHVWTSFMSNSDAIRHSPSFQVEDAEQNAKKWINKQLDRYESGNFEMLALIDRKSNEFIGQCGLLTQEVDGEKELEIGYSLIKKHWGKDLATEVAIHLRNSASKNSDINSIISIIKSDTEASKSVANKLGMKYDQELVWKEIEVTIFRINNPNSDL